jgi:hypothetical protein
MMVVTAPEICVAHAPRPWCFLAGGISNCPNWQSDLIAALAPMDRLRLGVEGTFFNPRATTFDVQDPNASTRQIRWEQVAMQQADIIGFWFSRGSDNPIVFFEYGMYLQRYILTGSPEIVVGCDPDFRRKGDVMNQTQGYAKPAVRPIICGSFENYLTVLDRTLRSWSSRPERR